MKFLQIILIGILLFTFSASASGITEARTRNHYTASTYTKAKQYVGLSERHNRKQLRKIVHVDPVRTPWCASFVNAVLNSVGLSGTHSNSAMSFAKYKTKTRTPHKGDIVVLRRHGGSGAHVGFFKSFEKHNGRTYVAVLGGNMNNKVMVKTYPVHKVISYRKVK